MNKFLRFSIFCFALISNCYAQTPDVNGILYVKAGTGGNGSSWANALSEFSDALKAAGTLNSVTAGTVKEIWVAGGTYYPLYAADYASTINRDKAFVMVADVNLYGGFAGTETAVSQRNLSLTANKTVLSGDLGVIGDYSDNAYHVLVAANNVGTAKMDGFTISYGSTGILSSDGTLNINGVSVYRYTGGGMAVFGAAPAITNVVICGNEAWVGAGMYIGPGAGATFTDCLVSGNRASSNAGAGFVYNGSVVFTNVTVAGNYAASLGGTFVYSSGSNSTFKNCIIYGNNTSSFIIAGVVSVQYSMVQGGAADATNHNLASVDPLFVNAPSNASAPFTGGDYSLTASSPVRDQGSNSLFTGLSAASTDLIGNPRWQIMLVVELLIWGALEFKQLLSQTITVADAVKTYGDADFEPVASASSGLAVTLQSSDATIANPYIDVADGNKWKMQILKAGTVTITASQAGNSIYAAATNKTFTVTINKAPLTVTANDAVKTYDGVGYSGGNGVIYSGFVKSETAAGALTGTLTYGGSSQGAVNTGSYVLVPSGLIAANYSITYVNGALTINKAALTVTANDASKTYDGGAYSGGNGVSYSGFVNGETVAGALTGTVAYGGSSQGAVNTGGYVLVPSGLVATNYSITYVNGALTINKAALTVTANDASKTYDGGAYSGGNGVSYSGFVNGETAAGVLTGTVAYGGSSQGAINTGSYVLVPSGLVAANYSITYVNGALTIDKAALTVTANDASKTYDGGAYSGGNGVSYSGFVNSETAAGVLTGTLSYGGSSQGAVDAGSYVLVPSGLVSANYTITYVNGSLTINKAALTVTANDAGKTYDGVGYNGGNGVSYSGFVNGETAAGVLTGTVTYGGSSQGAVDVGSYVLVPSGLMATNYSITYVNGALTINKAALTVTANDANKTYDGVGYSGGNGVSYSGFVNGETAAGVLTGTVTYGGSSQGAVDAGSYVIVPSGLIASNYSITYVNGALTINKAALTVTANDAGKTYDGVAYSGGNGISYSGFVNGETAAGALTGTLTYSGNSQGAVGAGSYVIVPSGLVASNYSVTYVNGALTINKAALTVTANDANKTYDGVAYSGGNGVSYSGFVNGETAAGALTGTLIYGGSSQGAVDAGSYVLVPSGLIAANYSVTYVNGGLTIDKAALTVTANDVVKTYDGVAYNGGNGVSYSGFVNSETAAGVLTGTVTYGGSSQGAVNAGSYVLVPSGLAGANYSITYVNGALTINKAALTVTANDANKTYDGVGYSGGNGVSYSGFVNGETAAGALTGTVAYGGSSQGAVNAGNYVLVPSGLIASNYSVTYVNGVLAIDKAALTVTANDANKTYDGVAYSGGNGVSYSGFVNGETAASALTGTVTYGGSSQGAVDAGSYVLVPSGLIASNYSVTYVNGTLTIDKAALTVTANDVSKTYDGVAYSGGNGVSYSGFVNGETAAGALTGTVTYGGNSQGAVDAGSYVLVPSGLIASNYSVTYVNGGLTINKAALTVTANDANKTYDGVAYSGGNGVSYSGFVNGETAAGALTGTLIYGGSSQGAVNAGSYVLAPSGLIASNYSVTYVNGVLTIDKAALTVTANDASKTYDGISYSGGNGVSYSGFVNGETAAGALTGTVAYGGSSQGAVNAGNYVLVPSGLIASNYSVTYVNGVLAIDKAALTVTANDANKTYDGVAYSGGNGVSYSGFVNSETAAGALTGTLSYGGNSQGAVNAGSYVIVPSGLVASNYNVTYVNGVLTIDKAALTVTANDANKTYDGVAYSGGNGVSYSGFVNGETAAGALTGTVTYGGNSQGAVDAGSYVIAPSGLVASNYSVTYVNGGLTIDKAALTVTANDANKTYDGVAYSGGNGVSYSGFVNGETAAGALTGTLTYGGSSQGAVNAGSYVLVPSGLIASNYSVTYVNGVLTIDKAALTVTANDGSKTYDGIGYSGGNGVSYSGFVNGETAAVALTGTISYGGTSQGAIVAGSYVIVPSGLIASNYSVTYVNGGLTIDKAALTVTANDANKTYDGVAYSGGNGVSYSGFVNGETAAGVLTGTLTYGGTSQGAINVNNYTIIPSGLTSNNYVITYVNGQLSINRASLEVKAINDNVTYSGQAYYGGNGVTYIGFVANEDVQVLGGSLLNTGSSQGAIQSGTYDIVPGGYTSDNYTITYTTGTLVIEKAALTVTAENQERCYGINNPSLTVSYNGWVNGESATVLNTQVVATTIATATSAAGTYAIVPSGASADNYAITYVNGILTVNALPEITLSASATVLCGNNASLSVSASGNYSYEWMLDNSVISGVNTSTLTATTTGVYTAIAKDGNGCSAVAANSITITKVLPPMVAFSYDSYCAGKEVTFTNTSDISTSGNVTYTWLSGDGQTSSSHDAAFTYASAGSYVAALTITPVACPALGVTSTQDINLEAQVSGERLTTITTTAGLATQLTARALNGAGYTWTPATGLSNVAVINPVTTLEDSQEYLIKMDFVSGCETIDTLLVNTVVRYDIIAANAFTPNGDGKNDVFKVHLRGIKQFVYMMIYDRWGNKIFETRDPAKGWDGRFGGELRELGTYIWSAEGIDVDGKVIHRQGVVTLVR